MSNSITLFIDPKPLGFAGGERLLRTAENAELVSHRASKLGLQRLATRNFPSTGTTVSAGSAQITGAAYDASLGTWAFAWDAAGVPAVKVTTGFSRFTAGSLSIGSNFTSPVIASNNAGVFVMGCRTLGGATANKYMRSTDGGLNWTTKTSSDSTSDGATSIIWVQYLGLFVSTIGTTKLETSPDGITWTARTASGVVFGGFGGSDNGSSLVVLAGSSDGANVKSISSPDGITWTSHLFNAGTASGMRGVVYSQTDSCFYAVSAGSAGGVAWKSTDASATWTSLGIVTPSGTNPSFDSLVEIGGALVTSYTSSNVAHYVASYDSGVTWAPMFDCASTVNGSVFGNGRRMVISPKDLVHPGWSI